MVSGSPASAAVSPLRVDASLAGDDGNVVLCELLVTSATAGVYDPIRHHLAVPLGSRASRTLPELPSEAHALVCKMEEGYVVLLAPDSGATLLLPREGAANPSMVRARPAGKGGCTIVAQARGSDPYAALLDAAAFLLEATGAPAPAMRTYILPLLDAVHRMGYTTAHSVAGKAVKKASAVAAATAALEQQLLDCILVQAGVSCPPKPLLQAPLLRVGQGATTTTMGVRYSGMSVVYGAATGSVLAVMDSAAALRMAPVSASRSTGGGSCQSGNGGSETPAGVSAGVSGTTSATPTPPFSRASSCGGGLADGEALEPVLQAASSLASMGSLPLPRSQPASLPMPMPHSQSMTHAPLYAATQPAQPQLPAISLSGRSITSSPIIQIVTANASAAAASASGSPAAGVSSPYAEGADRAALTYTTPTGASALVLASFALVGVKAPGSGRDTAVRSCRVMPASALASACQMSADESAAGVAAASSGLGVALQVEVAAAAAGSQLLVFVESSEGTLDGDSDGEGSVEESGPVQHVSVEGKPAKWSYDSTACMLKVELPGGLRSVQVYL